MLGAALHLPLGLAGLGHPTLCVQEPSRAPWPQHCGPVWMAEVLGSPGMALVLGCKAGRPCHAHSQSRRTLSRGLQGPAGW